MKNIKNSKMKLRNKKESIKRVGNDSVTIAFENFEGDVSDWKHDSDGGWELSEYSSYSDTHSFRCANNSDNYGINYLVSPSLYFARIVSH